MKYMHVRIEFKIHPLAVDDQINRTETSGYILTEAKILKFYEQNAMINCVKSFL